MTTSSRQTTRNVASSAVAQVAAKATSLVWTLLAARRLTQTSFGTFNLMLAVALLASSCAEWGFDPRLIQRSSRQPDRLPRHYAEAIVWQGALALPLFTVAGTAVAFWRPASSARTAAVLLLLAVFLDLWSDTSRAASAAALDQRGTSVALVVQRLCTMVLAVLVLAAGGGIVGLAGAFLASSAVGCLAHQVALRRLDIRFSRSLVTPAGLREFGAGTWALGISALVLMALFRVDTLLLGWLAGDTAVAAYSVAYRVFETVLFLVFAVSAGVYPVMSARADEPEAVRTALQSALVTISVAYLPFAAICLVSAPEVLHLLFGARYAQTSAGALRWLAFAPLMYAGAYLASAAVTAAERTRLLLSGAVVALVVNIVANLVLIPRFGGTGSAIATTVSYGIEAVVLLVATSRVTGRPHLVRGILAPTLAAAGLAGFLMISPWPVLVEVPIGLLLYAATWAGLAAILDRSQLDLLLNGRPGRAAPQL